MISNGQHSNGSSPDKNGGLGGDSGTSLDMSRGKDREFVRRALARGWAIDEETAKKIKDGCTDALEWARAEQNVRGMASIANTFVAMNGQDIQVDSEELKYDRIDSGLATERVELCDEDAAELDRRAAALDAVESG